MNCDLIQPLTGLRALAAFDVFFSHFPIKGLPPFLQGIFSQGYIGVGVFYVLSGFLIAYNYYPSFNPSFRWCRRFWWRRFARIYPVYLLILLATALLLVAFQLRQAHPQFFAHPGKWWFLQFTLLKGYFTNSLFTGIPQAWSLTAEFTFYISTPLLFIFFRQKTQWLTIIIGYVTGLLLFALAARFGWHPFLGDWNLFWFYTFFGRCFEFILGMLLALNLSRWRWLQRLPGKTYVGFFSIILIQLLLFKNRGHFTFGFHTPLGMLLANWALPLAVALLLAGLILEKNTLTRFLATRLMQLLGKASYAFYLLQFLVMAFIIGDYQFTVAPAHFWWLIAVGFLLTNIIAIILYLGYKKPIHNLLTRVKPFSKPIAVSTEVSNES
ncbi:acyltransferase family protein [Coxiella burnetii]|uniref:acyltransferase family protein n=1 Tax=Coxiella burnetii TaxID=777 RepID=UPI000163A581|nr:acyltransferase [Coxiella burnetii]ATN86223.1 acyltransferase [Coxiella burnetii str. Schperling]EDR35041.1 acyltransferase family protein [Coxiella burnetii Q321]PHH56700.1 acyltransferase [Coxiella burnetii]